MYRRLVVGTDGSETATVAVRSAARVASGLGSELRVVVADPSRDKAAPVLERALDAAREEGAEPHGEVRREAPAYAIMAEAQDAAADLIVVGNKGMGKPRRFMVGSVPDRIAHSSPCDLLIVRTVDAGGPQGRYSSVLVATDGSPTATQAVRRGYAFARGVGASVTLVSAGDPGFAGVVVKDAREKLGGDTETREVARAGEPAEVICDVAESESLDLVVVGNRGMQGMQRYVMGSVPNKVIHYAPTDVLLVRTVGRSPEDLAPGEAAIVLVRGQRAAAYRDDEGNLHAVSARCAHLGCAVAWNAGARTWDCPCHGSRYTYDGDLLQGPAKRGLERIETG